MSFEEDTPRRLTVDEIISLSKEVAPPQIAGEELRNHTHDEILRTLQYQLQTIKIRPSKIKELGDYIANKSARSFIDPGMPVGFNAAESVGQPATQLVLNTFHSAGQVGQNPFVRFYENIQLKSFKKNDAESNMKNSMKIHMKNKNYSFEDLYIYAQKFVSISMYNLLDKSDIIEDQYPFDGDADVYTEDFKAINNYKDEGGAIRLKFDRELLFLHQIPLENIAIQIEKMKEADVTVFCGPQYTGIIDIYPKKSSICQDEDTDFDECIEVFKNGPLLNYLKINDLGNYPFIHDAQVRKEEVIKIINDVTPHYTEEGEDESRIRVWIDLPMVNKDGIPVQKLEDLLETSGYNISDADPNGMYFVVDSNDLKLKDTLDKEIKAEDKRLMNLFAETGFLETSDLYRAAYYCFIVTKGSELERIRIEPDVDEENTICNCVMEIYDVLGIEVARNYLEKEIYDLFVENDQFIAPRNIGMIADWMCSRSKPISVNPKSVPKNENSILRAMCFENPKDHVVRGAVLGTEEPISNVSARVMFGLRQTLGTGSHDIIPDPTVIQEYMEGDERRLTRLTRESLELGTEPEIITSALPQVDSALFDSVDQSGLSQGSEINF